MGGDNMSNIASPGSGGFHMMGAVETKTTSIATGVLLTYNSYAVAVNIITASKPYKAGWNDIAVVPEGLRPKEVLPFLGVDNNSGTTILTMTINKDGKIRLWLPSDLTIACMASAMYLLQGDKL